jgi:hypothetical protein
MFRFSSLIGGGCRFSDTSPVDYCVVLQLLCPIWRVVVKGNGNLSEPATLFLMVLRTSNIGSKLRKLCPPFPNSSKGCRGLYMLLA